MDSVGTPSFFGSSRRTESKEDDTFDAMGCSACHLSDLGPATGANTDLLLHDMGHGLSEGGFGYSGGEVHELAATSSEWRTPPLCGLGSTAPYLHDGRAQTLLESIEAHGSEASAVVARFQALPDVEKDHVLAFLQGL